MNNASFYFGELDGEKEYYLYAGSRKQALLVTAGSKMRLSISMTGDIISCWRIASTVSGITEIGGLAPISGLTEMLAGQIANDRLVSANSYNYLDLAGNRFRIGNASVSLDWNVKGPISSPSSMLLSGYTYGFDSA